MPPPVEYSGDGSDGQHTDARICEGGVGSAVGGSDRPGTRHVENGAAHELRHHREKPGIPCYAVRLSPVVTLPAVLLLWYPHRYNIGTGSVTYIMSVGGC